jgi:hypothetical protein
MEIPFRPTFGLLRMMMAERRKLIAYLEKLPEEDFRRTPDPAVPPLAHAIYEVILHDWLCLDALEGKSRFELPGPEQFPNVELLIGGMKAVEVRKFDLLQRMDDADLDTELNVVHREDPQRRATVRDILEALIDVMRPHFLAIGYALRALGRKDELKDVLGMYKAPSPQEFN